MSDVKKHLVYLAVDPVILSINNDQLEVLLFRREKEPFTGKHELPGVLMQATETANDALTRRLATLFTKKNFFFQQFGAFTQLDRDPRLRAISLGFVALLNREEQATQPPQSQWYPITKLPELAFDHAQIIAHAREFLKQTIKPTTIKHLLPKKFPLNQLQRIYELIEEKKYDNRNFRKWVIGAGIVKETKEREENVSHRPAILYVLNDPNGEQKGKQ